MSENRTILVFENSHSLANHLIQLWDKSARQSIEQKGCFNVVLSGGKTPIEFYCKLSALEDFDLWQHTHLFSSDERFVPFDDASSNYQMVKEYLIDYINIPSGNIHPIYTDKEDVQQSANCYQEHLKQYFSLKKDEFPIFDLMLLGIGTDGHTASLFPEDKTIKTTDQLCVCADYQRIAHKRISVSLPVINHSKCVIFLVSGEKKSNIVERIICKKDDLPATHVNLSNGDLYYYLDKDASSQLSYNDSFSHHDEAISLHL